MAIDDDEMAALDPRDVLNAMIAGTGDLGSREFSRALDRLAGEVMDELQVSHGTARRWLMATDPQLRAAAVAIGQAAALPPLGDGTPPKPERPDVRSPASGGGLAQTAGDEIDRLAVELVERGRVESYGEALHQVVNDPQHRHTVEAWSRPGGS